MWKTNAIPKLDSAGLGIEVNVVYKKTEEHGIRPAALVFGFHWFNTLYEVGFWWL